MIILSSKPTDKISCSITRVAVGGLDDENVTMLKVVNGMLLVIGFELRDGKA